MEEDIKVLKNIINELKGETHYLLYTNNEKAQALENLIARNKKLEEDLHDSKEHIREFLEKSKMVTNESKDKTYLLIDVTEIKQELLQEGDK